MGVFIGFLHPGGDLTEERCHEMSVGKDRRISTVCQPSATSHHNHIEHINTQSAPSHALPPSFMPEASDIVVLQILRHLKVGKRSLHHAARKAGVELRPRKTKRITPFTRITNEMSNSVSFWPPNVHGYSFSWSTAPHPRPLQNLAPGPRAVSVCLTSLKMVRSVWQA